MHMSDVLALDRLYLYSLRTYFINLRNKKGEPLDRIYSFNKIIFS